MYFELIIWSFIIAFFSSLILTPLTIFFAQKFKIIDDPKTHIHPAIIHKKPIPRAGGIALFLAVFLGTVFFANKNLIYWTSFTAGFIALITGVIDDKYDISRYKRLFINIACALLVVIGGVSVPSFITNPMGGIIHFDKLFIIFNFLNLKITIHLADIVSLFWIVWVMNMLNWSKGIDGQMPGILTISAFIIGILSLRFPSLDKNSLSSAYFSFAIAGAALGFLIFNFHPAKIFPGYGATSVYLLLAVASILSSSKLATGFIVMAIPMIDGTFTITRRILSGKSPVWGDKKHLHHLLLKIGYSQREISFFYWIVTLILGIFALSLSGNLKFFAIVFLIFIIFAFLLFLHFILFDKNEK